MKLIHANGFRRSERRRWRAIVYDNLLSAILILLDAMDDAGLSFSIDGNAAHADVLRNITDVVNERGEMDPKVKEALGSLWEDEGIKKAIGWGARYALHDNLSHFFDDLPRLFAADYLPSDQDILCCRCRTTGISETTFHLGTLDYRMVDVGGQRSERRKWIHCFDNVNAIIFLAAISGYDVALLEDRNSVSTTTKPICTLSLPRSSFLVNF